MARRRSVKIATPPPEPKKPVQRRGVALPTPDMQHFYSYETKRREKNTYRYESFSEYLTAVRELPRVCPEHVNTSRQDNHCGNGNSWFGRVSWDETLQLAYYGWDEGRERCENLRVKVAAKLKPIERPKFKPYHDFSGGEVSVGRYLSGVPECMVEHRRVMAPSERRICKIVNSISVSGEIDAEVIMRRGASIVALVDALELSGVTCEVWNVNPSHDYCGYECWINVKQSGEPLDVDAVAFQVAHPASFRRLEFSHMEQRIPQLGLSYGSIFDISAGHLKDVDIYLGSMRYGVGEFGSEDSAAAWVQKQVDAQLARVERQDAA